MSKLYFICKYANKFKFQYFCHPFFLNQNNKISHLNTVELFFILILFSSIMKISVGPKKHLN